MHRTRLVPMWRASLRASWRVDGLDVGLRDKCPGTLARCAWIATETAYGVSQLSGILSRLLSSSSSSTGSVRVRTHYVYFLRIG